MLKFFGIIILTLGLYFPSIQLSLLVVGSFNSFFNISTMTSFSSKKFELLFIFNFFDNLLFPCNSSISILGFGFSSTSSMTGSLSPNSVIFIKSLFFILLLLLQYLYPVFKQVVKFIPSIFFLFL